MSTPVLESAFTTGEVAPALFGNVSLARMHSAASTMRNFFVAYQGGAYSRAGTALVGFSKQTGRNYPPRMITFQFSINQGLALEFGNFYMRVVFDGAYVSDVQANITGVTQTNPAVISFTGSGFGAASAVPITSGVTNSYAPGDLVTLAGGIPTVPTVLSVTNTKLTNLSIASPGAGVYAPADTIHLAGGTQSTTAILTVSTTKVVSATIANAGSGATVSFNQTVTGTTGTGVKFQAAVVIASGHITSITSISFPGDYTVNPTTPSAEPVTGVPGLTGATLNLVMGVNSIAITNAGVFTANPSGGNLTQASTSGSGTGATFTSALMGPNAVTVSTVGIYTTYPTNPVAQASTTGAGVGATFTVTTTGISIAPFNNGDWVNLSGIIGPTAIDGGTYVLENVTGTSAQLYDVYGNTVDGTGFPAYVSGGLASRIYTLTTIYAEQDIPWLKFTQSADVMSICCVNQLSGVEYPSQDLSRVSDDSWTFTPSVPAPTITAPGTTSAASSTSGSVEYQYQVTSVSPTDGTESIASTIATAVSAVDIAATAGTITVTWTTVATVTQYNIYKATPGVSAGIPTGALFGYAGTGYGNNFIDTNIVPDFAQVPPTHRNPFARGQILSGSTVTPGSGYSSSLTYTINTSTGSGAVLTLLNQGGNLAGIIVDDPGENYAATDTISIGGSGSAATASIQISPQTGTYPGVVAYFQQRRAYAYTLNEPDTYFMSQPGSYTNFDIRIPTIDSDAITGSPWSNEVNGIQFMVEVTGGLMVLTGLEAYFLAGSGSSPFQATALTPSSQSAIPQGFNGCSPTIPPIRIYQDVLYVQAKGSTYRDFSFNIQVYTYTGEDITQNSTQLFNSFTIREHAWCEEPYRVLWAVRNDGVLLSLTFVKAEKVQGWARHDTNGLFQSICSVTEPPVDALYAAVQRTIGSNVAYTVERMDDRLWNTVEEAWCVDCGLSLPMTTPAATLMASSATGLGSLTGVTSLVGGQGYSAGTTFTVVDNNGTGPGTGAVATGTIVGGVVTGITFSPAGSGYVNPQISAVDPAGSNGGSGFSATVTLNNTMTFTASTAVFSVGNVGSVIRMGGGVATITAYTDTQHVTANITSPIVAVNSGSVIPQTSGNWTISAPVTVVGGLAPLNGATVTGLADGVAIPPTVVANGQITLGTAASAVTIGLGFDARLQSVYLDAGEPTIQGRRGLIPAVTARVRNSGPFLMGENQPDGSTLSPMQIAPPWQGMQTAPITTVAPYNSVTVPLCTDDIRIPVNTGYSKHKQVCVEQNQPYPLEVLAFVPEFLAGDKPSQEAPQKQGRG